MLLITGWRISGVGSREFPRGEGLAMVSAMKTAKDQGSIKDSRNSSKNIIFNYVLGGKRVCKRVVLTNGDDTYIITSSAEKHVLADDQIISVVDPIDTLLAMAREGVDFVAYKRPSSELPKFEPNICDKKEVVASFVEEMKQGPAVKSHKRRAKRDDSFTIGDAYAEQQKREAEDRARDVGPEMECEAADEPCEASDTTAGGISEI